MTLVLPKKNLRKCYYENLCLMIRDLDLPAVRKFSAHFLQVRVPHVLNSEDEDVLKVFSGFLDIGEQLLRKLLALLVRLRKMYNLGAL